MTTSLCMCSCVCMDKPYLLSGSFFLSLSQSFECHARTFTGFSYCIRDERFSTLSLQNNSLPKHHCRSLTRMPVSCCSGEILSGKRSPSSLSLSLSPYDAGVSGAKLTTKSNTHRNLICMSDHVNAPAPLRRPGEQRFSFFGWEQFRAIIQILSPFSPTFSCCF